MSLVALELRGLRHRFGSVEVVHDVHLRVRSGDIFGFLGLNGAGKTTTLRLILGLIRPRAGAVVVFGHPGGRGARSARRNLGVLFEDFSPHPYLTGRQVLRTQAQVHELRGAQLARAVDTWLARVGLADSADRKTRGYSLGMKRRLGLACALVHSPRLVLLDEPTNGLDPTGIEELRDLVRELNREHRTTFLISSHILGEVERMCNRVAILHAGKILREGDMTALVGGERRALRVRASDLEATRRLLAGAPWCEGFEATELREEAAGGAAFEVRLVEAAVPRMVRELVEAGVEIFELTPRSRRLEDVFRETVAGTRDGMS